MLKLYQTNNKETQPNDQEYIRQTSLGFIPMQSEKLVDGQPQQHIGYKSKLVSMDCIPLSNSPKKKSQQRFKNQDFAKFTATYMKRGTLDSDMLDYKNDEQLSEKDYILYEILKRNVVDVRREEDSNMVIYILRKVTRNNMEMEFLKKVIEGISLFKKNPDIQRNCSNQILTRISHSFYKKNQVIFNYGDHGSVFYLILKGSVYCLIPNKDYKSEDVDSQKKLKEDNQSDKLQTQQSERQNTQTDTARNRKKLVIGGQHQNLKRLKSQEDDLHEFDLESGAYEPPKSPLKKNKLILKPNRSQSFSGDEEDDEIVQKRLKEENKKLIQQSYAEFDIIKELKQGESFGEIAVLTGEKRTATMICSEDTHLLALSKKGFDTILGAYKQFIMQDTVEFLRKFPFLKSIPSSQLLSMFQSMKEEKYVTGNPIYTEKDPCNSVYFIKSGEIEISKLVIADQINEEESEFNEFRKKSISDVEKNKVFNLSKKTNKQRIRLYQLGSYSYFGAQDIMKKLPHRETQAKCISQEAIVYSIDKKMFKREIQIKMDWEEERDKKIQNKAQLNKMLIHSNSAINNRILKSEDNFRKGDIFQSKFSSKDSDSTISSQFNTMTTFSVKNQRKSYETTQSGGFFRNDLPPMSEYYNQQSFRQIPSQSQIINPQQDYVKNEQLIAQPDISTTQKSNKNKLPMLQSNFIEFSLQKKNQRSNSLNQLITRQNKPMIDALMSLKSQGFDITQLSKLSLDELKELTRKMHKNLTNTNSSLTGSRRNLLIKDQQQEDSQNTSREKYQDGTQSSKNISLKNENKPTNDSYKTSLNDNSMTLTASQSAQNIFQSSQYNKSKLSSTLKNIDISGSTQTSSKKISQLIRKSFDYSNGGQNSTFFVNQINNKYDSPSSSNHKPSSKDTPPKQNSNQNPIAQCYTPDSQTKKEQFFQNSNAIISSNYSIFNANKPRSNTDQFSQFYRTKNTNQPFKGSTIHNDRQSSPHYKFEEELIQRNLKSHKNKDYFEKDIMVQNNNNNSTFAKKQQQFNKQVISTSQRFSLTDSRNPLNPMKQSDSSDLILYSKKSPRGTTNQ